MKTLTGEDLLDVKSYEEIIGNSSDPDITIITSDDDLDKILSNMEKASSGHFGSVCE